MMHVGLPKTTPVERDSVRSSALGSRPEAAHVPEVEREVERVRVDMWDRPLDDPNTVSNLVRRYTVQWGLPQMREEAEGEKRHDSEPGQSATDGSERRGETKL